MSQPCGLWSRVRISAPVTIILDRVPVGLVFRLLLPVLGLALPASAGELESQVTSMAEKPAMQDGEFLVAPLPIVDPTLGYGGGLVALFTAPGGDDGVIPRSNVAAGAAYTDTGSYLLAAGGKIYAWRDRVRISATLGYGHLNLLYYGIGGGSSFSTHPVQYFGSGIFASLTAEGRVDDGLYLGVTAKYLSTDIGLTLPIDVLPVLKVNYTLVGLGPRLAYDTRDNQWWPKNGTYSTVEYVHFDHALGSDVTFFGYALSPDISFSTFDADVAHYWELDDDLVLAAEARMATASEGAPFFMYPFISVRGFSGGEYLDRAIIQAQAELRWNVWGRWGVVAFGGGGAVASDLGSLTDGAGAVSYGAGLRYRLSDADRMNIGVDVAFGGRNMAIYFRIGEAF